LTPNAPKGFKRGTGETPKKTLKRLPLLTVLLSFQRLVAGAVLPEAQ
jgi:hypothetical protein